MNKIFFIIGASGSGKSTTVQAVEKEHLPNFKIFYFDSIGVPSFEEMHKQYGSLEEWQRIKTNEWVERIRKEYLVSSHVILDGQIRPTFIEQACKENRVEHYEVVLFDCNDQERKRRLIKRGQPELNGDSMMNWAAYLRRECQARECFIIDNTNLELKNTISLLVNYLEKKVDIND